MNNEMIEALRSVLKEELKSLNDRQEGLDNRLDGMDKRFDGIDNRLDGMNNRLNGIDNRLDGIEQEIKEVKTGQEKLQKSIIKSIGEYTEKIADYVDVKTEVLNKRVFKLETEVQRLTRQ